MLPRAILAFALLLPMAASAQLYMGNEQSEALRKEGEAFEQQDQLKEAMARYAAAFAADRKASLPVARMAYLYLRLSQAAQDGKAEAYRGEASKAALTAINIDGNNTLAMEVLRQLDDPQPQARYQPGKASHAAMQEGEALFHAKKYPEAIAQYQQALALDARNVDAIVYLGDCYFAQGDYLKAEKIFLQATQSEPLLGIAWRFLFDTQMRLSKLKDAETSALGAIAARPSELPSWLRMGQLHAAWGQKLARLRLVPRARLVAGTRNIEMDTDQETPDSAAWLAYAMAQATESIKPGKASPFEQELAAWTTAVLIIQELGTAARLKDEGLRQMIKFHEAGQLKAALFALRYREAWRPDFEAWKKAEPDGLKKFIDTFHIGP